MSVNWDPISIRNRITQRLQSKAAWAAILYFSSNLRLIDAFAEEMADLANYNEYLTRETKWSLARNRSSLMALEGVHRYNAHRKIGASGEIRVGVSQDISSSNWVSTTAYVADDVVYYNDVLYKAITSTTGDQPNTSPTKWSLLDISPAINVDIPKWTTFSDSSGTVKFVSYSSESLNVGQNFIDIPVVQGIAKSVTYTATGIDNEEFTLVDNTFENTRYELYVNNVLWTKVNFLLESGATDTDYEIENIIDFSGVYLKFGDDNYGKKLSNGDIVKLYYVSTLGSSGNINSSNLITTVASTLYDTLGNKVTAYCLNKDSLLGGKDEEDIESIRLNAPKIFQTGDRASSSEDYKTIIELQSFVLKANVWGSYEHNLDLDLDPWTFVPTEENVVHVAGISTGETNLTTPQKNTISTALNTYKSPTDIVSFETVRFLNLAFRTTAFIRDTSYTLSSVSNAIIALLASTYSVSALDLHQSIYFSDYQSLIDAVAGVDHHTTYVEIFYDFLLETDYVCSMTLPSESIKTSSVRVYIQDTVGGQTDWTLIGADDGAGGFTAVSPYGFTIDAIDYSTGVAILKITGLTQVYTNYTLRSFYRLESDDLILQERYDIFKFDSTNSTISSQYEKN